MHFFLLNLSGIELEKEANQIIVPRRLWIQRFAKIKSGVPQCRGWLWQRSDDNAQNHCFETHSKGKISNTGGQLPGNKISQGWITSSHGRGPS